MIESRKHGHSGRFVCGSSAHNAAKRAPISSVFVQGELCIEPATNLPAGEAIYRNACLACHGESGTGGHGGGPALLNGLTTDHIRLITTTGRNNMPTFTGIYTPTQIRDVSEYIVQRLAAKPR